MSGAHRQNAHSSPSDRRLGRLRPPGRLHTSFDRDALALARLLAAPSSVPTLRILDLCTGVDADRWRDLRHAHVRRPTGRGMGLQVAPPRIRRSRTAVSPRAGCQLPCTGRPGTKALDGATLFHLQDDRAQPTRPQLLEPSVAQDAGAEARPTSFRAERDPQIFLSSVNVSDVAAFPGPSALRRPSAKQQLLCRATMSMHEHSRGGLTGWCMSSSAPPSSIRRTPRCGQAGPASCELRILSLEQRPRGGSCAALRVTVSNPVGRSPRQSACLWLRQVRTWDMKPIRRDSPHRSKMRTRRERSAAVKIGVPRWFSQLVAGRQLRDQLRDQRRAGRGSFGGLLVGHLPLDAAGQSR